MSDEEKVSQALAELWDIVKCRCNEAYTGRGLHDPDCQCDSTDALQTVADIVKARTKERDTSREYAGEVRIREKVADDARIEAEAKLARAVAGLKPLVQICELMRDGSGFRKGRYQHEVTDSQWAAWCKQIKTTRAVLADLEGK